jgi:transglutaminase-like putative cysteine protease
MRLFVRHVTHYRFDKPATHGLQRLRLKPKSTHGQSVIHWDMDLTGAKPEASYEDHNQNSVVLATVLPGIDEVTIACSGEVETVDNAGIVGPHSGPMPVWAFLNQTALTRPGPRMHALVATLGDAQVPQVERLHALSRLVLDTVSYEVGHTGTESSAEDVLAAGHGVCQDHAHVFIGCARALGIPTRYVSGYLMMNDRIDQEAGHAWAEAHVEGLGWVGFDVSNGISPDARYIRVASGCDYRDAAPVTGLNWGVGETALAVRLEVEQKPSQQ